MKKQKEWMNLTLLLCSVFFLSLFVISLSQNRNKPQVASAESGFDEFGYNRTARNFVGTCKSWYMGKFAGTEAEAIAYCGRSANDKLVMKWNAEWDRGNLENWTKGPYDAWENNEWNGKVAGGSGEVWHYKIRWDKGCAENNKPSTKGGYCIWGQFVTLMDQGTSGGEHFWFTKATPNGYGVKP